MTPEQQLREALEIITYKLKNANKAPVILSWESAELIKEVLTAHITETRDDMRGAFEKAMIDGYDFTRDNDGMYVKPDTFEAYEGWKAALALPAQRPDDEGVATLYAYRQNIMQDGVEKHFISFSVKYPCTLKDAECLGKVPLQPLLTPYLRAKPNPTKEGM